jgi:thiol-disulfide isomerase/thioredoxin
MALRVAILLFASLLLPPQAAQNLGTDLSGNPIHQLAPPGTKAVVLFFAASDCPISNRYIPEIERLNQEFASQGVAFWWVYPNPTDTAEVVHRHQQQFNFHAKIILDTGQRLTQMAHAAMTPEVAIFVPAASQLSEVYLGRIDNRYIALGQERPAATTHDLQSAIHAVLAHQLVPKPGGPAVGCAIVPLNAQ